MIKIRLTFILALLLFVFLACDEQKDCCTAEEEAGQFTGSWLLFEHGYSPGAGYITEAVQPKPKQAIVFDDGRITSTVKGFEDYKFYRVLEDTVTDTPFVAFYIIDPDTQPDPLASNPPTYSFQLKGDTLKLYFRYCFEGCHLAFRKL